MFRDSMIYHQSKLMMQPNKFIPNIVAAKYSEDKEFKQMAKNFKVTEYPTVILFDKKGKPFRTVIGFSWY